MCVSMRSLDFLARKDTFTHNHHKIFRSRKNTRTEIKNYKSRLALLCKMTKDKRQSKADIHEITTQYRKFIANV